jgi:hypothetical protein
MKILQELKPSDMKHSFVPVEPTPIGPPQTVRVVDEVAVYEIISDCDDILLDALLPLLRPKKRTTDEADRRNQRKRLKRDYKTPECSLSVQQGFNLLKQDQWYERCDELCHFYMGHGHRLVSHHFEHSPVLAQWVKRQRRQYKLKTKGRSSTLTEQQEAALEQLGLTWRNLGRAIQRA